jgi:hypothetical protein
MWYEQEIEHVIDDTTTHQVKVGEKYKSLWDTVEIIDVSPILCRHNKCDVAIKCKVIEHHVDWYDMIDGKIRIYLFGDFSIDFYGSYEFLE